MSLAKVFDLTDAQASRVRGLLRDGWHIKGFYLPFELDHHVKQVELYHEDGSFPDVFVLANGVIEGFYV